MKQFKFVFALLAVFSALSFGLALEPTSAAVAAGERCTCKYESGSRGVIEENDCVVRDCWTPIEELD